MFVVWNERHFIFNNEKREKNIVENSSRKIYNNFLAMIALGDAANSRETMPWKPSME
jgi:hypothetical protein